MTCLSVSFKAALKAINTNKCHIHVLLQLYVQIMLEQYCFSMIFQIIFWCSLVGMIVISAHIASLEKSEIANINLFQFEPKTAKILN